MAAADVASFSGGASALASAAARARRGGDAGGLLNARRDIRGLISAPALASDTHTDGGGGDKRGAGRGGGGTGR